MNTDRATLAAVALPPGVRVFERGWLSSNNVLLVDEAQAALVDTGYASHAEQTVALVQHALGTRPLDLIVNTHLHSDHCGGNAALQRAHACRTVIPAAQADAVQAWDQSRLSFRATGQRCARFAFTGTLAPGARLRLGALDWEVLGAPGHDPHSLMLYSPRQGLLVSADALWENGFGVIFPELEGASGFAEQQAVLELIAGLDVRCIIPGHGAPFTDVAGALERACSRLAYLREDPRRNARNALKVLIVFKLLECRVLRVAEVLALFDTARAMGAAAALLAPRAAWAGLLDTVTAELVRGGTVRRDGDTLHAV